MSETRKAVINFLSVEKIKSELIIASKLILEIETMKKEEKTGAQKMLLSFLDALRGEVHLARNVSGSKNFDEVDTKMEEASQNISLQRYAEALKNVSEAISFTTTLGQQATQTLTEKNIL